MKKVFVSLFIFIFSLFLISCNKPVDNNQNNGIDCLEYINGAIEEIVLPSSTSKDINLPEKINYYGYDVLFTWETSDDAISNNGKVTQKENDVTVYLTVTATLENETVTKTLDEPVIVKAKVIEPVPVDYKPIIEKAIDKVIKMNSETLFPTQITEDDIIINLSWNLSEELNDSVAKIDFANHNIIYPLDEDIVATIKVTGTYQNISVTKEFDYTLKSLYTFLVEASSYIDIPTTTYKDIELPNSLPTPYDAVDLDWYSFDPFTITKSGEVSFVMENTTVTLSCGLGLTYYVDGVANDYFYDVNFDVVVTPIPFEERERKALISLNVPEVLYSSIILPTEFENAVYASWSSSNTSILSNEGIITKPLEDTDVTLEVTFIDGVDENNISKYQFIIKVMSADGDEDECHFESHNIIDRVENYSKSHLTNLKYNEDNKIVLEDNALSGTYESKVFYTKKFDEAVGSWSCITNGTNATCELEISVYVNDTWSKYFSYGNWGLGKINTYYNQTDTYAKMSVDEILITTGNASAIKYRITLRRDKVTSDSPVLSLVCLALDITEAGYKYNVDISSLPKTVVNDCPKLYQYDVPGIGGSICSATTTTMLLKWKGHSFKNLGYTYEHEFIANMVADPGHNSPTYGNWSYNMAVAGAYGEDAYVARMFSINEVIYHLATVGPMGASIKSSNGEWGYKTNGHLVVVIGYKMNDSGQVTTIICNDPAKSVVYYEVTLNQFMTCWRNIAYVLE